MKLTKKEERKLIKLEDVKIGETFIFKYDIVDFDFDEIIASDMMIKTDKGCVNFQGKSFPNVQNDTLVYPVELNIEWSFV